MSWGYKILILYLGFVGIIITLVVSSFNQKIEIVATDYYERELHQQDIIDGSFNLNGLNDPVVVQQMREGLQIVLPKKLWGSEKKGELWLYHIMNKSRDYQLEFSDHWEDYFLIPGELTEPGPYIIKLRWHQNEIPYYFEERVNLTQ